MSARPSSVDTRGGRLALARTRRLRQGGRAFLLWSLLVYGAVQAVFNHFMDRDRPLWAEVWRTKWGRLREVAASASDQPLLVMLGSSRSDCALQAGRLNDLPGPNGKPFRAYNFGVPVAGPLCQMLHLRGMLDNGIRPDLLLVEVSPPFFNQPGPGVVSEDTWPIEFWMTLPEMLRLWPYFTHPVRKMNIWMATRLAGCNVFRPYLQARLSEVLNNGPGIPEDAAHDAWGYKVPTHFTAPQRAVNRVIVQNMFCAPLRQFHLKQKAAQALRDLLELCRKEHIPVALVLLPESSTFRSWYSPEARTAVPALLADLCATYHVPLIDATCWIKDEDFSDYQHVQEQGAVKFTDRLRAEITSLLKQPGTAQELR